MPHSFRNYVLIPTPFPVNNRKQSWAQNMNPTPTSCLRWAHMHAPGPSVQAMLSVAIVSLGLDLAAAKLVVPPSELHPSRHHVLVAIRTDLNRPQPPGLSYAHQRPSPAPWINWTSDEETFLSNPKSFLFLSQFFDSISYLVVIKVSLN